MSTEKPPVTVDLKWQGELRFAGSSGGHELALDSAEKSGVSPIQALGLALAGCMAMDVVHILTKGRSRIESMTVRLTGRRADEPPRRFVDLEAQFSIRTDASADKVERAIALSREKYCAVWHSMRTDIGFRTSYVLEPAAAPA
jgi:putative redox protein